MEFPLLCKNHSLMGLILRLGLALLFLRAPIQNRAPEVDSDLATWSSSWALFIAILPLAAVHTLGNLFINRSGKVAVPFTFALFTGELPTLCFFPCVAHTIKATEPFFSVVLALCTGELPALCFFPCVTHAIKAT
ncbi:hypothetical protein AMTR_s00063p00108260 [Amborella trichopoda]|uniref:Uncharacterized protein n=1 Tax=Amborella trichopoda TaxID=13333 RepID=U5D1X7_AMBTC|nr:hypothetical protein AMTR_s00063p00108260 [Amborella trichopoda]